MPGDRLDNVVSLRLRLPIDERLDGLDLFERELFLALRARYHEFTVDAHFLAGKDGRERRMSLAAPIAASDLERFRFVPSFVGEPAIERDALGIVSGDP